jgi:hypothetical protein
MFTIPFDEENAVIKDDQLEKRLSDGVLPGAQISVGRLINVGLGYDPVSDPPAFTPEMDDVMVSDPLEPVTMEMLFPAIR